MRFYETTFIVNPQTDDATIEHHVKDVADLITNNSGNIIHQDHMGTRRLAYAINGLTQGYYASFIFEAPTSLLPMLDRHFMLNEQYIRNLTVRFDGDPEKYLEELSAVLIPRDSRGGRDGSSDRRHDRSRGHRSSSAAPEKPESSSEGSDEKQESSAEAKPAEAASVETKTDDTKSEDTESVETKSDETESAENKSDATESENGDAETKE